MLLPTADPSPPPHLTLLQMLLFPARLLLDSNDKTQSYIILHIYEFARRCLEWTNNLLLPAGKSECASIRMLNYTEHLSFCLAYSLFLYINMYIYILRDSVRDGVEKQ